MTDALQAPVLVVAPLREEMAALRAQLSGRRRLRAGRAPGVRGRLGDAEVHAVVVGDGADRAAASLEAVLQAGTAPVRGVLVIGVAGALAADLRACELVAAERIEGVGGPVPAPDAAWLERLPADLARRGLVVSAANVASTAAAKRALAEAHGPEALAVDLESAALAQVAARHALPYLVLRSISDTRDESLPRFFAACMRPDGSIRRGRVLGALLRKPRRLRTLLAVGRRMRRCAEALAAAAAEAVACAPPP